MNRAKKILILAIKAALAVALSVVLIYSVLNYAWGRSLETRVAHLKAEGKPVTLADLKGPDIPDEENGAVIYEKIFALLPEVSQEEQDKHYSRIIHMSPKELRAQPEVVEDARRQLALREEALALVEEAVAKPKCRFGADWENAPQVERPFEYSADLRELTRLLSSRAILAVYDGNMGGALHNIRLAYGVSTSLDDEPALIGFLVKTAISAIASRSLQNVLLYGDVDESETRPLFDQLGEVDLERAIIRAWETERVVGLSGFRKFGGMRWDEVAYHRLMDKQIRAASLTFSQSKSEGLLDAERTAPAYPALARIMAPTFVKASETRYRTEAQLAGVRTILALHTYRSNYGSYPQSLEQLERDLGWVLPKDPFSESDLVYRQQDEGFLLYSVGLNMTDDGGVQDERERGPDIVWSSDR